MCFDFVTQGECMKKRLILTIALALFLVLTFTSCEWFTTVNSHDCESICQECGKCFNTECEDEACAEKCEGHIPPHRCESICEDCGGCLNAECAEDVCYAKCSCSRHINVRTDIVATLEAFLYEKTIYRDPIYSNTETKIDDIRSGKEPLLITFDLVETYYVGVYFSGEHYLPDHLYEIATYCCVENYVWVRFDSVEDIAITYDGLYLLDAFVVREIDSVSNLLSDGKAIPRIVIFDTCKFSRFSVGEVQSPKLSNDCFIYLNGNSETDIIYHYTKSYNRTIITLPCAEIDGNYYIKLRLRTINNEDIVNDFGKYYDELFAVIKPDIYITTDENGNEVECYLVNVNDFAEIVKGE